MGVFKCGGSHFQRDCNARQSTGKQSYGKGKQSKSWSKSEDKGKSKENKGKFQRNQRCQRLAQGQKHPKLVSQVLKTRNQRLAQTLRNLHKNVPLTFHGFMMDGVLTIGTMAGVLMNGMMTGVLLDGTKVVNKHLTLPQAHFHLEVGVPVPPVVRSGLNG